MEQTVLIKGGAVVTMDAADSVFEGDVLVRGSRIESVGRASVTASATADVTIDARGCAVIPGFVQTHVHLCQTLFRGAADDLELIDWLKKRVNRHVSRAGHVAYARDAPVAHEHVTLGNRVGGVHRDDGATLYQHRLIHRRIAKRF